MDMSGAVPMYLNQFCDFFVKSKPGEFQVQQAMSTFASKLVNDVGGGLGDFVGAMTGDTKERFYHFAELFLRNDVVPTSGELVDHRYFYIMPYGIADPHLCRESGHGYAVCGLARDILAGMLRKQNVDSLFLQPDWINSCRTLTNPSSRGFVAEQIIISSILSTGLALENLTYKPTENIFFTTADSAPLVWSVGCLQYAPQAYNYKHIDSLIRLVDKKKGNNRQKVTIIAVQATLQPISRHKYSLDFFRSGDYKLWERDLTVFEVDWHFVWVVCAAEYTNVSKSYPKATAGNANGNLPAFTEHALAFGAVNEQLDFL